MRLRVLVLILTSLTQCSYRTNCSSGDISCNGLLSILLYQQVATTRNVFIPGDVTVVAPNDRITGLPGTALQQINMTGQPHDLVFDPDGANVFISHNTGSSIDYGKVSASGFLDILGNIGVVSADEMAYYRVNGSDYLYITNGGATVAVSQVIAGVLQAANTYASGNGTAAIIRVNSCLYVAGVTSQDVSMHVLATNGTPGTATGYAVGATVRGLTVHPNGNWLYVANEGGSQIRQYQINSDCTLSLLSSPTVTSPSRLVIDPTGSYLYAVHLASAFLRPFAIDRSTGNLTAGNLTAGNPVATNGNSRNLGIDARGRYVYVVRSAGGMVDLYDVATPMQPVAVNASIAAGTAPWAVKFLNGMNY